jgi:ribosomal peptide maturation radical SAM protein 1
MDDKRPKVALVYPPFGPKFSPPLGLALLSAGVKKLGFDCRTFFWSMDLIEEIQGGDLDAGLSAYEFFACTRAFPVNEWIFAKQVFPELPDDSDLVKGYVGRINLLFDSRFGPKKNGRWRLRKEPSQAWRPKRLDLSAHDLVYHMRDHASVYVATMADRLAIYDIIGIASTFYQNLAALALAKELKRRWPQKTVVLGGANCEGVMGQAQAEQFSFLDYVFSGEVDFSFPEFVRRRSQNAPVDDLPGIIYRDAQGKLVTGPSAPPLQALDELPLPDYDDLVATRERMGIAAGRELVLAVESARGCWWGAKHHCTFCGLNALGMDYRQKRQERFQWEIEELARRYGTRHFYVTDNILSMSYFNEFVKWAEQSRVRLNFFWEIKANLTRRQVESLAHAGINWLQPGIESFSSEVLDLMRKGVKGIQNIALLKYARENGMLVPYFILYGFPGEEASSYEEMARRVRMLVHLEPPRTVSPINYERFNPYFENRESYGLRLRPIRQYRMLYPFSDEIISRLVYYFERDDGPKFPYIAEVKKEVIRWQKEYARAAGREQNSSLSWVRSRDAIVIDDHRPGFPRCRYRLQDHAIPVFHALDRPTTLKAVVKETKEVTSPDHRAADHDTDSDARPSRFSGNGTNGSETESFGSRVKRSLMGRERVVSFSREEFERNPAECLEPLVTAGILYVENDWYIALPVVAGPNPTRSTLRQWSGTTAGVEAMRATPWWHGLPRPEEGPWLPGS